MKAETLKPFITSPSVTEYMGNRKRNVIFIGLSIFLFIIIASLFGFTIWSSIRVTQLEKELNSLNQFVNKMHKRLGLDYLDELKEFENNYANNDDLIDDLIDDDDDDEEDEDDSGEGGQLLNNFDKTDYDDDDDNKKGRNKNSKENSDDLDVGSGNYDDDDDDDDDDEYDDDDDNNSADNDDDNGDRLFDDFEKYIGSKKRRTRSVAHKTDDNDDDKVEHKNKHLEAQLKLVLQKNEEQPSKSISKESKSDENAEKLHKKNTDKSAEKSSKDTIEKSNFKPYEDDLIQQKPNRKIETTEKNGIKAKNYHEDNFNEYQYHDYVIYPYVNHHKKKMHILNTATISPLAIENLATSKSKKRMMKMRNEDDSDIKLQNLHHRNKNGKLHHQDVQRKSSSNIIAAHFNLNRLHIKDNSDTDSTEALLNHQRDFENSIYLPTISSWSTGYQPHSHHQHPHHHHHHQQQQHQKQQPQQIDEIPANQNGLLPSVENGIVTIQVPGIYYIYAQIYYHNNKDHNGYWIYHNAKPFLQCYSTIPNENVEKGNTCYTSGIQYLTKGDTIHLKDMFKDHSTILGTSKSFFGLVRLGDAEYYHNSR